MKDTFEIQNRTFKRLGNLIEVIDSTNAYEPLRGIPLYQITQVNIQRRDIGSTAFDLIIKLGSDGIAETFYFEQLEGIETSDFPKELLELKEWLYQIINKYNKATNTFEEN